MNPVIKTKNIEVVNVLKQLKDFLNKQGLIEINPNSTRIIVKDKKHFFNLGYILFLLHIGARINHSERTGSFYFATTSDYKNVYIIKNYLQNDSNFWLFYHNSPLYIQETFILHIFVEHLYSTLLSNNTYSDKLSDIAKSLIEDFQQTPEKFLKDEYEIIDIIKFPIKILKMVLDITRFNSLNIDPFQVFLYLLFNVKMETVYLEAYIKGFKSTEKPWDLLGYDKDNERLFFVELTTGHSSKRLLKKFPVFLESLEKNGKVIYITCLENLEPYEKTFLKYISNQFKDQFFLLDSSIEKNLALGDEGINLAQEKFKELFDVLNNILN